VSNWPTVPLIRIIKGYDSGRLKEGVIAFRYGGGSNYRGPDCCIIKDNIRDRIDEWEEVTPVPTAALKRLQNEFRRINVIKSLEPALLEVLSYLPATTAGAISRAVTDAQNVGARGILEDFSTDDRIRLLLDAIGEVHAGDDRRYRLAWVVRLAYTWADLTAPDQDALEDIRSCAADLLDAGDLEDLSIIHMARSAGLVAGRIAHEALLREALIDLGTYALAWAAQTIEEEDQ
jgi:hypothetical protein